MDKEQAKNLLERFRTGHCTAFEKQLVENWYEQLITSGQWSWEEGEKKAFEEELEKRLLEKIDSGLFTDDIPEAGAGHEQSAENVVKQPGEPRHKRRIIYKWAVAAAFLLLLGSSYLFFRKPAPDTTPERSNYASNINDRLPATNKATLTLGNGEKIVLNNDQQNAVLKQDDSLFIKLDNNALVYDNTQSAAAQYNTLTTPRGGQYQVWLPDGSKVWLNAASSLTYPVSFTGKERIVSLQGEGYFEIATRRSPSGQKIPFKVMVNNMQVEVLGTHFNIKAYADESSIRTTLLEGSVKVKKGEISKLLKPNQQAAVNKQENAIIIQKADVNSVMAWKNGLFDFHNARLEDVMREVSRWYDIDVVYQKKPPQIEFVGKINRSLTLTQLLNGLSGTGFNFKLQDGRKLIITP